MLRGSSPWSIAKNSRHDDVRKLLEKYDDQDKSAHRAWEVEFDKATVTWFHRTK